MGIAWLFYMYAVGPAIRSVPIFFLALLRFDYIFARSVGEIFPFIWIVIFQVLEQLSAIGETNGFPTRGSLTDLPTAPPPPAQLTMPGSYYYLWCVVFKKIKNNRIVESYFSITPDWGRILLSKKIFFSIRFFLLPKSSSNPEFGSIYLFHGIEFGKSYRYRSHLIRNLNSVKVYPAHWCLSSVVQVGEGHDCRLCRWAGSWSCPPSPLPPHPSPPRRTMQTGSALLSS